MNRETERRFAEIPKVTKERSRFKRPFTHKTTFNTGDIIPIFVDEILPGDTVSIDVGSVIRMSTPLYPVMDNAYMDIMFFSVPNRLIWEHWQAFWGENEDPWAQTVEYEIPQIKIPEEGWEAGTIADYMGIPTRVAYQTEMTVNALPFRAYAKIWNDWFRDENIKKCANINLDDATVTGSNGEDYVIDIQLGGKPAKAAKFHDYFTSCLPSPQKATQPVTLPLGAYAPVGVGDPHNYFKVEESSYNHILYYMDRQLPTNNWYNTVMATEGNWTRQATQTNQQATNVTEVNNMRPVNLWTNLKEATGVTIQELRTAFAIQRFYEAQARGGTRYIEFLKSIFGVTSPDARLQRSEYLGGKRIPINMDQVLQTSATTDTSVQGRTGAYSCTINSSSIFTKSFTEHEYLIGICVIRTDHTYQQGLNKMWSRKKWTDFYIPQFAHLSEMPVYIKEITAHGDPEAVFGYQEAWAEYRYLPSRVSGAMKTNYPNGSLDAWHYADWYVTTPTLSPEWIDETTKNVDRTLAVQSSLEHQFIADFYFDTTYVRQMPLYSVPGLLDHM
ncbi:major capsid protein [Capybara microvirus Cap1_SP_175]|nr:major capsid protein [Capybara microvirus Cap1_SP_175]